MNREEAKNKLAGYLFKEYSHKKRKDTVDSWFLSGYEEDDEDIKNFPEKLRSMIREGKEPENTDDSLYDPIILASIKNNLYGTLNEYLQRKLAEFEFTSGTIEGEPEDLSVCPCCHYHTLSEPAEYDICPVCFWEDDGVRKDSGYSGPNHMTLGEGRNNFNEFGACDRKSLSHIDKDGPIKYKKFNT
jgi:hypothetical protein